MIKTTHFVRKNPNGEVEFLSVDLKHDVLKEKWGTIGGETGGLVNSFDHIDQSEKYTPERIAAAIVEYDRIFKTLTEKGYVVIESLEDLFDNGLGQNRKTN